MAKKKIHRRFLAVPFKVVDRLRFHRWTVLFLISVFFLLMGPLVVRFQSATPKDYRLSRERTQLLEKVFSSLPPEVDTSGQHEFLLKHFSFEEGAVANLIPGTEKKVVFPGSSAAQDNALGLIYFHGFMATRKELSPVIETVSEDLALPVFYSRVAHHGIEGDQFEQLVMADFMASIGEAEVVAKRLAKTVAVVGMSTGAAQALAMAQDAPNVKALILIAPNLGLTNWSWPLLQGPLGAVMARVFVGKEYSWQPLNPDHGKYWKTRVDANSLRAMAEFVQVVKQNLKGNAALDVLVVQNPNDTVVDNAVAKKTIQSLGFHSLEFVELPAKNHVLAGDIVSPENTARLIEISKAFLQRHGLLVTTPSASQD